MREKQRDLIENSMALYRGRCGHQWVGAYNGYYGCPVCSAYDGDHHLIAMEPIAVQPDDWGSGTWQRLAENQTDFDSLEAFEQHLRRPKPPQAAE